MQPSPGSRRPLLLRPLKRRLIIGFGQAPSGIRTAFPFQEGIPAVRGDAGRAAHLRRIRALSRYLRDGLQGRTYAGEQKNRAGPR